MAKEKNHHIIQEYLETLPEDQRISAQLELHHTGAEINTLFIHTKDNGHGEVSNNFAKWVKDSKYSKYGVGVMKYDDPKTTTISD